MIELLNLCFVTLLMSVWNDAVFLAVSSFTLLIKIAGHVLSFLQVLSLESENMTNLTHELKY